MLAVTFSLPLSHRMIDCIMRETTRGKDNGIQWTLFEQLDDINFSDDLTLLALNQNQMQVKTCRLETFSAKTGLRINLRKTNLIKMNTTANTPITVGGEPITEVESFVYLVSTITKQGGTDEDVTSRIGKARGAFIMLKKVWVSKEISTETKMRIVNYNVKSVLFYGCETWKTTGKVQRRLQTFLNTCLRRTFGIRWSDRERNEVLWERAGQEPVSKQILKRKWSWIGHTLRKPPNNTTRQALRWNPQGNRKRGRPLSSRRRSTETERALQETCWNGVTKAAQDRVRWQSCRWLCSSWSGPK